MRKFNIFMINNYYADIYLKRPDALYNLLNQLNNLDRSNFEFGCEVYDQISLPINTKALNNFISNRCKNELLYENVGNVHLIVNQDPKRKTKVSIYKSHIKVKTNDEISFIINIFNDYAKTLFVCDFDNKNYFWLGSALKFSVV